jgi:hypothetical protein
MALVDLAFGPQDRTSSGTLEVLEVYPLELDHTVSHPHPYDNYCNPAHIY